MNLWRDDFIIVKALNELLELKVKVQCKQDVFWRQSSGVNACLIAQTHCASHRQSTFFMEAMSQLQACIIQ